MAGPAPAPAPKAAPVTNSSSLGPTGTIGSKVGGGYIYSGPGTGQSIVGNSNVQPGSGGTAGYGGFGGVGYSGSGGGGGSIYVSPTTSRSVAAPLPSSSGIPQAIKPIAPAPVIVPEGPTIINPITGISQTESQSAEGSYGSFTGGQGEYSNPTTQLIHDFRAASYSADQITEALALAAKGIDPDVIRGMIGSAVNTAEQTQPAQQAYNLAKATGSSVEEAQLGMSIPVQKMSYIRPAPISYVNPEAGAAAQSILTELAQSSLTAPYSAVNPNVNPYAPMKTIAPMDTTMKTPPSLSEVKSNAKNILADVSPALVENSVNEITSDTLGPFTRVGNQVLIAGLQPSASPLQDYLQQKGLTKIELANAIGYKLDFGSGNLTANQLIQAENYLKTRPDNQLANDLLRSPTASDYIIDAVAVLTAGASTLVEGGALAGTPVLSTAAENVLPLAKYVGTGAGIIFSVLSAAQFVSDLNTSPAQIDMNQGITPIHLTPAQAKIDKQAQLGKDIGDLGTALSIIAVGLDEIRSVRTITVNIPKQDPIIQELETPEGVQKYIVVRGTGPMEKGSSGEIMIPFEQQIYDEIRTAGTRTLAYRQYNLDAQQYINKLLSIANKPVVSYDINYDITGADIRDINGKLPVIASAGIVETETNRIESPNFLQKIFPGLAKEYIPKPLYGGIPGGYELEYGFKGSEGAAKTITADREAALKGYNAALSNLKGQGLSEAEARDILQYSQPRTFLDITQSRGVQVIPAKGEPRVESISAARYQVPVTGESVQTVQGQEYRVLTQPGAVRFDSGELLSEGKLTSEDLLQKDFFNAIRNQFPEYQFSNIKSGAPVLDRATAEKFLRDMTFRKNQPEQYKQVKQANEALKKGLAPVKYVERTVEYIKGKEEPIVSYSIKSLYPLRSFTEIFPKEGREILPTPEPTVKVYQGTTTKYGPAILKEGIKPAISTGINQGIHAESSDAFVTIIEQDAEGYANRAVVKGYLKGETNEKPFIVKGLLTRTEYENYLKNQGGKLGMKGELKILGLAPERLGLSFGDIKPIYANLEAYELTGTRLAGYKLGVVDENGDFHFAERSFERGLDLENPPQGRTRTTQVVREKATTISSNSPLMPQEVLGRQVFNPDSDIFKITSDQKIEEKMINREGKELVNPLKDIAFKRTTYTYKSVGGPAQISATTGDIVGEEGERLLSVAEKIKPVSKYPVDTSADIIKEARRILDEGDIGLPKFRGLANSGTVVRTAEGKMYVSDENGKLILNTQRKGRITPYDLANLEGGSRKLGGMGGGIKPFRGGAEGGGGGESENINQQVNSILAEDENQGPLQIRQKGPLQIRRNYNVNNVPTVTRAASSAYLKSVASDFSANPYTISSSVNTFAGSISAFAAAGLNDLPAFSKALLNDLSLPSVSAQEGITGSVVYPAATPASIPVSTPIVSSVPIITSVPVTTPVTTPILTPLITPIEISIPTETQIPTATPVVTPTVTPVVTPVVIPTTIPTQPPVIFPQFPQPIPSDEAILGLAYGFGSLRNRAKKRGKSSYNVLLYRGRGRNRRAIPVASGLPFGLASQRAEQAALRSIGRTSRIVATGGTTDIPDIDFNLDNKLFRQYFVRKGKAVNQSPFLFVQRQRAAITTPQEKMQLKEARRQQKILNQAFNF